MARIIGRKSEINILQSAKESSKSELIAVYGRRRVGKTFLIREFYKSDLVFETTGLSVSNMKGQLENFHKELVLNNKNLDLPVPNKWFEAFTNLELYLNKLSTKKKKVLFIDEFPWVATTKSNFLGAFENFWNSYCTKRNDLIVVICGSAAAYMVKNIIRNKKGLHNRITRKIRMLPFNLSETKSFLKSKGIQYTDYDIAQLYMVIGGVPHYLENIQKGLSVSQNIDNLCFTKDGVLNDEFNQIFASLFDNSEKHMAIIKALSESNKGVTRTVLSQKVNIQSGGDLTLKLEELVQTGFISDYPFYQNKKKLTLYRLSDEYSKFYLKFIDVNKNGGDGTWLRLANKQSYKAWSGFAFESLCLKHISQIKKALRIEAIYSINSCWFNRIAQIDLLIDRDDNIMNLCELKFYNGPFTIDKSYYLNLKNKVTEFQKESKTAKNIFITMLTTYGLIENKYSNELVQNSLEISCLFNED